MALAPFGFVPDAATLPKSSWFSALRLPQFGVNVSWKKGKCVDSVSFGDIVQIEFIAALHKLHDFESPNHQRQLAR